MSIAVLACGSRASRSYEKKILMHCHQKGRTIFLTSFRSSALSDGNVDAAAPHGEAEQRLLAAVGALEPSAPLAHGQLLDAISLEVPAATRRDDKVRVGELGHHVLGRHSDLGAAEEAGLVRHGKSWNERD